MAPVPQGRATLEKEVERALDLISSIPPPDCDRIERGLRKVRRLMRWSADSRGARKEADELIEEAIRLSGAATWRDQ